MKVFHILYQSLPQVSGSSIRSRDILISQKNIGIDVIAITSPFTNSTTQKEFDVIHDIKHYRTSKKTKNSISDDRKNLFVRFLRLFSIISFFFKISKVIKKEKPDVLHAHAMFYCGLPAIFLGKIYKIPVVYELRSVWMYKHKINKNDKFFNKLIDFLLLRLEIVTLKKSDYIVFLNNNLKAHIEELSKNFPASKVISNAVNLSLINSISKKTETDKVVFGYIGTLTHYEGIEFLIETFQEMYAEGFKYKLLIYGNGICRDSIIKLIDSKENNIFYKGSFPPDKISSAYSEVNVIINPRLNLDVTNNVTPLKPLEAIGYKKIFIGSDVKGIKELITNKSYGFLFKSENKEDLKSVVKKVYNLSNSQKNLILEESYNYVKTFKDWESNAFKYEEIYTNLIKNG
jgi:glycogen(starch) synthase